MTDRIEELAGYYKSILNLADEKRQISKTAFLHCSMMPLDTLDEMELANNELIHFLKNHKYYDLLERIEKGEAMEAAETDPVKKREYQALLKIRYAELEKIMPKESAA